VIIGDAHDQSALALHQFLHLVCRSLFVMPKLNPGIGTWPIPQTLKHGGRDGSTKTRSALLPGHDGQFVI
jgi:hypothetical protein